MSLLKDEVDGCVLADDDETMKTAIIKFVLQSKVLQIHFKDKCKEVLNSWKKTAKHAYFGM